MRKGTAGIFIAIALLLGVSAGARARELSFDERVRAQAAIDRVYYSHQAGATKTFEEAVPRSVLEAKVRNYLKQSVALEELWKTPITGDMLDRELARMAAGSRLPDRLEEIFAALGHDAFVIKECLARAALADRLSRNFYAFDATLHAGERAQAERIVAELSTGAIDPLREHEGRSVVEVAPRAGELLEEQPDSYVVSVALTEAAETPRAARYVVPKLDWDSWWHAAGATFHEERLAAVADSGEQLAMKEPQGLACANDDTWNNGSLDDLPDARSLHTAVWTGSLMIVWGGLDLMGSPLQTGGRYDPATDTWSPTSTAGAPAARASHSAVWTGNRMVIWGGSGNDYFDTGGIYDPATDSWTTMSITGAATARVRHSALWTGSSMLVWGGEEVGGARVGTGGRYDPATDSWTSINTTGAPAGRSGHVAVWTGSQMIVWGGLTASTYTNTGGRYDPATDSWTPTSTSNAPSARWNHVAVWTGSQMIVWGGMFGVTELITGGRYDLATDSWIGTMTTGAPAARTGEAAIWTGDSMVIWGGVSGGGTPLATGARYKPSNDSWTPTNSAGAPVARTDFPAVWTGTSMILWGGSGDSAALNSGSRYNPGTDTWTPTATAPLSRSGHTAVWTGSVMLVWGGVVSNNTYSNTGGRYDPATDTWTAMSTTGAPSGRSGHSANWTGSRMVVWGGYAGGTTYVNTGGQYDPATDSWTAVSTTGAPSARRRHSAIWTGSALVVWGGQTQGPLYLNTGGRYDPVSDTWTPTTTSGSPTAREQHTAVWTGSRMVVWGGYRSGAPAVYPEIGRIYDPAADTWTTMTLSGAPAPRRAHTAVWTGTRMVIWGGADDFGALNSGAQYDPLADSWTPTTTTGAPTARESHTAVWTGTEMVVWGGNTVNTGGRYDPAADSWSPTSTVGAPAGGNQHTAVWTGNMMVVWGGTLNTGGRYLLGANFDGDGDGISACAGDCNDSNPDIYPGAAEVCDGLDNDCNGVTDDSPNPPSYYHDADGDGYGDPANSLQICAPPANYVANADDCDDGNPSVHPGATEVCNGIDDDCDLAIDEDLTAPGGPDVWMFKQPQTTLTWAAVPDASAYDVVSGSLSSLRTTRGDFTASTTSCLANDTPSTSVPDATPPALGDGWWYLVRAVNCGVSGSYQTGSPREVAGRDTEIAGSDSACP